MESTLLIKMLNMQKNMDERNFILSTIAYNAAPTLLHNKPASMISFTTGKRNLFQAWEAYKNDVCLSLGIDYYELVRTPGRVLVLFYNRVRLTAALVNGDNQAFLMSYGYSPEMTLPVALLRLKGRMEEGFPHEIGIFLGYPIEDVLGYIENNGKEYLLCRYWKVYKNPGRAQKLFNSYDRARIKILNSLPSVESVLVS